MAKYVYPDDALPEMEYVRIRPPVNNCSCCGNTYVTNKGAVRPGRTCIIAEKLFREKKIENGNEQVDCFGTCKFWCPM